MACELVYDALERRPCSDYKSKNSENNHDRIFDAHTDSFRSGHVVPVGAGLNDGRECQSESREAQSTEKRDEQFQFWNRSANSDWKKAKY